MPYLERKNTEEMSGVLEQVVDGLDGLEQRQAGRRSAAERSPGEGHGGVWPRCMATRQERRR